MTLLHRYRFFFHFLFMLFRFHSFPFSQSLFLHTISVSSALRRCCTELSYVIKSRQIYNIFRKIILYVFQSSLFSLVSFLFYPPFPSIPPERCVDVRRIISYFFSPFTIIRNSFFFFLLFLPLPLSLSLSLSLFQSHFIRLLSKRTRIYVYSQGERFIVTAISILISNRMSLLYISLFSFLFPPFFSFSTVRNQLCERGVFSPSLFSFFFFSCSRTNV